MNFINSVSVGRGIYTGFAELSWQFFKHFSSFLFDHLLTWQCYPRILYRVYRNSGKYFSRRFVEIIKYNIHNRDYHVSLKGLSIIYLMLIFLSVVMRSSGCLSLFSFQSAAGLSQAGLVFNVHYSILSKTTTNSTNISIYRSSIKCSNSIIIH